MYVCMYLNILMYANAKASIEVCIILYSYYNKFFLLMLPHKLFFNE